MYQLTLNCFHNEGVHFLSNQPQGYGAVTVGPSKKSKLVAAHARASHIPKALLLPLDTHTLLAL